jgi:hypothetical protein
LLTISLLELGAVVIVPVVKVTEVMSVFAPLVAKPVIAPPRVRLPAVVTVPESVNPLTVPVPDTLVTVPDPPPPETHPLALRICVSCPANGFGTSP